MAILYECLFICSYIIHITQLYSITNIILIHIFSLYLMYMYTHIRIYTYTGPLPRDRLLQRPGVHVQTGHGAHLG